MLVKPPSSAASVSFPHEYASTSPQPSLTTDSEGEPSFVMAPRDDGIEYHFRASARLCFGGRIDKRVATDRGRESDARPGAPAPGFGLDVDYHTGAGGFGSQLTNFSVALRLFDEDKTFWGSVSADTGEIPDSMLTDGTYLPRGLTLLHREAALSFPSNGLDRTAAAFVDVRRQANVSIFVDESLIGRIPMATLAQLIRLSECHFCRTFKRSFGFLPRGFRIGLRFVARPEGAATHEPSERDSAVTVDFVASGAVRTIFPRAMDNSRAMRARS